MPSISCTIKSRTTLTQLNTPCHPTGQRLGRHSSACQEQTSQNSTRHVEKTKQPPRHRTAQRSFSDTQPQRCLRKQKNNKPCTNGTKSAVRWQTDANMQLFNISLRNSKKTPKIFRIKPQDSRLKLQDMIRKQTRIPLTRDACCPCPCLSPYCETCPCLSSWTWRTTRV